MHRRHFSLFVCWAPVAALLGCSPAIPEFWTFSVEELEAAMQQRFPQNYPVAGLLQASLAQPQLLLLPDSNQVQVLLQVAFSGPALGHTYVGSTALRCSLRFEPEDASVRAQQVQVEHLRLEGAPPSIADMISAYGPYLAEKALQGWTLYQLDETQRQQLRRWGVMPADITVLAEGLRVRLLAHAVHPDRNRP